MKAYLFLLIPILTIFNSCKVLRPESATGAIENIRNNTYAIRNVNIIPMTVNNTVIENTTVIIKHNKIQSFNQSIPDGAIIINGKGKWLIPGLIDMHIHGLADIDFGEKYPTKGATFFVDNQNVMTLFVANGVTTIFDLNARAENIGQRNEIIKGNVIGPRVALAALINGGEGSGRIANTASDGRQTVRIVKAEGYEFIKLYSQLNIETYLAIIDEAGKQGVKVVGHIPNAFSGRIGQAFVKHFDMVAHAEEFSKQAAEYTEQAAQHFAALAKENGTWLTPTLVVMERIADQARSLDSIHRLQGFNYVHPLLQNKWLTANQYNQGSNPDRIARFENMIAFHKILVKAFKKQGVPIVAGTDAGVSGVIWGYSLHDELELLVEAGLSAEEAMISATRLPANWLGIDDKVGTVEVGKLADLILLDANPLAEIKNTRKIAGVFFNGRWINKKSIDKMLINLDAWNQQNKSKYNWKDRKNF